MFYPLSLSAPPLACSAPGAESNSVGGAEQARCRTEKKIGKRDSAPLILFLPSLLNFSAPPKINPGYASGFS